MKYRAFGLTIDSELALPELAEANASHANQAADLVIHLRPIGRKLPLMKDGVLFDYDDPKGVVMAWPDVAGIRMVDNRTVWMEPYPGVPETYLAFPLLGPVMAWVLMKLGLHVLHASCVAVDGRSVVLMGDKLAGKSTTAAAFIKAGHPLVTDDLLAIDLADTAQPIILPAFAQLKLSEDSANAVKLANTTALPLVHEGFIKRQHRLPDMHDQPIAAEHFFVLTRGGDVPRVEPLPPEDRIKALMRYGYACRFDDAPAVPAERATQFRQCVALANQCEIAVLHIPADLKRLPETVAMVERHVDRARSGYE